MAFLKLLILTTMVTLCSAQPDVCGTCENSCGTHNTYCGCDALCKIYNDCCFDFEEKCYSVRISADTNLFRFGGISPDTITECKSIDFGTGYRNVPLVTQCPHDPQACDIPLNREQPSNASAMGRFIPVTELSTGLSFVNARCAECNRVEFAVVWSTKLLCDDHVYVEFHVANSSANSSQVRHATLEKLLLHPDCKLSIQAPVQARRPCDPDLIDTCTDGSRWSEKECRFGSADFVNNGVRNFKNRVCANCNGNQVPLNCGLLTMVFNFAPIIYGKFSLSLLLDYSGDGLMLTSGKCDTGFTKVAHDCLPIICPAGSELKGNDCIEIPKLDVTIQYHVTVKPEGRSTEIMKSIRHPEFLYSDIELYLQEKYEKIGNLSVSFNRSGIITIHRAEGIRLMIPGEISYTVYYMTLEDPNAKPSLMALSMVINDSFSQHLLDTIGSVNGLLVEMRPFEEGDMIMQESAMSCTQVQLSPHEFEIENGTILVLSTGQNVAFQHVTFREDGTVGVCETELLRKPASSSSYLGITTIVVLSISLLCLLVRIVFQFFLTAFHTAPMKTQFCLSLALFVGFLAFLVNPFVEEGTVPCLALGVCIQWVFLLAFCIMMTIAFDMWWIFRPSGGFMKLSEGEGFFWRYILVSLLVASTITAVGILFEFAPMSEYFKPRYGEFLCFFNNTSALLVFFVIPLIGIVLINLILFTMTCVNLHRALASMQKFQQQKWRQELCLYIRLFSLMGITWVFGIVAPVVPSHDILWYLFVIFNGLQGLYIFIAYVCTKKVYNELKRICGKPVRKPSMQTTRSESVSSRGSKRAKYQGSNSHSTTSEGNRTMDTSVSESEKGTLKRSSQVSNGDHAKTGVVGSDRNGGNNGTIERHGNRCNSTIEEVDGENVMDLGLPNGSKKLPTETSV